MIGSPSDVQLGVSVQVGENFRNEVLIYLNVVCTQSTVILYDIVRF